MDFREALDAIENGARVRRDGWHKGRRWIARQDKDGFAEYVMARAKDGRAIAWQLALGPADCCTTGWIVSDAPAAHFVVAAPAAAIGPAGLCGARSRSPGRHVIC